MAVDAILTTDKAYSLMNDVQKAEYTEMLLNMSEENFALYSIMSELNRNGVYNKDGFSAYYSPASDKVFMDINNTKWQQLADVSSSFNRKTKFHE